MIPQKPVGLLVDERDRARRERDRARRERDAAIAKAERAEQDARRAMAREKRALAALSNAREENDTLKERLAHETAVNTKLANRIADLTHRPKTGTFLDSLTPEEMRVRLGTSAGKRRLREAAEDAAGFFSRHGYHPGRGETPYELSDVPDYNITDAELKARQTTKEGA